MAINRAVESLQVQEACDKELLADITALVWWPMAASIQTVHTMWGRSSAGRASRSQCEGQEFDPPRLHQLKWQALV